MKFLEKIVEELIMQNPDLSGFTIVLPGKRPIVFIKKILVQKNYSGFLPHFITIEDLIKEISGKQLVDGIALWLFAYQIYQQTPLYPKDDFSIFLKWFPTVQKDWDDMMKFSENDLSVLEYMLDDERIKLWAEQLGEDEEVPRKKYLNFWKNMNIFLPILKENLKKKNWATLGMQHESAKEKIPDFVQNSSQNLVFCGFNAFTPIEEKLVKNLLKSNKAQIFFQSDQYYMEDEKQEAGIFLREYRDWKIFNEARTFNWIEDDFSKPKNINVYEVSGNVTQTKLLPEILKKLKKNESQDYSDTAIVLLDENLLPAALDTLNFVDSLNITMGFPLKNLGFSNAIKHIFHLQKQLEKKNNATYYYKDILPILEELPNSEQDLIVIQNFKYLIEERNIVYISEKLLKEKLSDLSYFSLFLKAENPVKFLESLIDFCYNLKFNDLDDIQIENIFHFEKVFKIIKNQIQPIDFEIKIETLDVLVSQLVNFERIDFQGEPLSGLQVMGLLETRLLNFKNIILLSVNEGKLPLGNNQNTFIPFDVRKHFNMHTFLENDSIYAYHFYRLLQDSENVNLLFNALTSGVNTGEKSRFITQLEFEDQHHQIEHLIIDNSSEAISQKSIEIEKTSAVLQQLELWKQRVSASHLTSYIYNPIDFYLNKILETKETTEIEEELSVRNYGNLVHYALQSIYESKIDKILNIEDLNLSDEKIHSELDKAIKKLKHQPEFYERGMNYIHKSIAIRVLKSILQYDLDLIKKGHSLKIIGLERQFENVDFFLNEEQTDKISFYGFIDRIDELDGVLRIIDYKTAKTKELRVSIDEKNVHDFLIRENKKQALQLCIYNYAINQLPEFQGKTVQTGIWSFAQASKGVVNLEFVKGNLDDAMISIKNLINEILNPEIPFTESTKPEFEY